MVTSVNKLESVYNERLCREGGRIGEVDGVKNKDSESEREESDSWREQENIIKRMR